MARRKSKTFSWLLRLILLIISILVYLQCPPYLHNLYYLITPDASNPCQREYDSFTIEEKAPPIDPEVVCKRRPINPPSSCEFMKNLIENTKDECSKYEELKICEVVREKQETSFDCTYGRQYCTQISLGTMDKNKGDISWQSVFNKSQVEHHLVLLTKTNSFILVECYPGELFEKQLNKRVQATKQGKYQQIIMLPVLMSPKPVPEDGKSSHELPSFNIMFFDSISRTKFYRTHPNTLELLRSLKKSGDYEVFDYSLFQSISRNTPFHFDNMFRGPNPEHIDPWQLPHEFDFMFVKAKHLFERFKEVGYKSIFVFDRCYIHHHLPIKEHLTTPKERYKLYTKMKNISGIENFGFTEAVCHLLLSSLGPTEIPYSSYEPLQRCFNGNHLIHYQLDSLLQQQKLYSSLDVPFVSFSEDNYAHNSNGNFMKFTDLTLKPYLEQVNELKNVITVMFSDHGGRQTVDYNQFPEGKTDKYHPFMFIIIPKKAKHLFSANEIEALRANQNRLVTVRDMYYFFAKSWNETSFNESILNEKSKKITCDDLVYADPPMSRYCFCDQERSEIVGRKKSAKILKFVENYLNEKTLSHRNVCKELKLELYHDSYFRITKDKVYPSKMMENYPITGQLVDSSVTLEGDGDQIPPIFDIIVGEFAVVADDQRHFEVIQIDRTDSYGKYETCTPIGVDPKTCIC